MSPSSFPEQGSFSFAPVEILDSKRISAIVNNILARFTFSLSATQAYMIQERCWLSQIDFFHENLPRWINVLFLSSQPHDTQTRLVLFLGLQISILNSELFPNRVPVERSRLAFPIIDLPEDERTDFAQEERLGLPCWTMILVICVLVDVSN